VPLGSDMKNDLNILIIDNDRRAVSRLEAAVRKVGYNPYSVLGVTNLIKEGQIRKPDLAILGPGLDEESALQGIHALKVLNALMPILCASLDVWLPGGSASDQFDGITGLSPDLGDLPGQVELALQCVCETGTSVEYPLLVGRSDSIKTIRKKIQQLAAKDISVLITGESGTGKELVARSIHCHSARRKGPLVKVNCGALPDDLIESEVFGFQRGAFTGAHKDKPGRFELASGGTLFIDEIGDLSFPMQAKFLQVLEDKAFSRLGDTYEKSVDTRVVTATNSDLMKKMQEGVFRKDLFYRLNVGRIHVPPLRDRPADISLLVSYFLTKYCMMLKRETLSVQDNVISFLQSYHWPGTVRELENMVRRAIVMRDWGFAFEELKPETRREDLPGSLPSAERAGSPAVLE
jgi:DNA-binding NtrC family response regulator